MKALSEPLTIASPTAEGGDGQRSPKAHEPRSPTFRSPSKRLRRKISLSRVTLSQQEPIELQIETMSPTTGRLMFYFWYGLLALAIVLESVITLQWEANNMCDGSQVSLSDIGSWSSNCSLQHPYQTVDPATNTTERQVDIAWTGVISSNPLARFLHIVFSMRNPNISVTATYRIAFGYTLTNTTQNVSTSDNSTSVYSIECQEQQVRCSTLVLATQTTTTLNISLVSLIATNVDQSIAPIIATDSAVGVVNQKPAYTIASLVVRYTLMLFSLLHLARFLYHKKFTNSLYEQTWITFLHAGLFLYLDPLFAAGVFVTPQPNVLSFLEFRVPTYFMALLVAFMFSLITSSMSWTTTTNGIYDPPWWTKLASLIFLLIIFTLDIIDSSKDDWNWNLEHCPNFSCNTIGYLLYGVLILGVLICTVWLYWLRGNLGQKPYLDSRPQQLAVRVFIFMFTTTVLYFVVQSLTIVFAFRDISGIVTYQALIQIPPILVSVFFVNIMTLVYTSTVRTERVPIRPSDQRWKKAIWPESWYQWLSRHGGSMYVFYSEEEEMRFYEIQTRFAERRARSLMMEAAAEALPSVDHNTEMLVEEEVVGPRSPLRNPARPANGAFETHEYDAEGIADEDDEEETETDDDEEEEEGEHQDEGVAAPPRTEHSNREPTEVTPLRNQPSNEPVSPSRSPSLRRALSSIASLFEPDDGPQHDDNRGDAKKAKTKKKKNRSRPFTSRIPGSERIFSAMNTVTKSVSRLVVRAENELIDRTANLIDAVENRFIDTFTSNVRRKPFFNLEMAMECLNLSWEAYGVVVAAGDAYVSTGVNVRLPDVQPAAKRTAKAIASILCCCTSSDNRGSDDRGAGEGAASSPASPPSTTIPLTSAEMSPRSATTPYSREYGSTALPSSTPRASAIESAPPINVEQYGYIQLGVSEQEDVQVVISKIDLTVPKHKTKFPRIVVAFRGTNSMKNAKQDLRIRRVAWTEAESTFWQSASASRPSVHEGFLSIWNALREFVVQSVLEEMLRAPEISYRLVVTGHSMGGAVATLCAFVMKKLLVEHEFQWPEPIVYTFGQPRIGNKSFQSLYNRMIPNTFRVVNESDAVSFVTMFGGCHVGMEVDIDRNGNIICEPMFMERTLRPMKGKGSALGNHMLQAYADSLNAIAARAKACPTRALVPCVVPKSTTLATCEPTVAPCEAVDQPTPVTEEPQPDCPPQAPQDSNAAAAAATPCCDSAKRLPCTPR